MAPARHHEKLGQLFMGIVGSGCAHSRIVGLGLVGTERWISRGSTGGITGYNLETSRRFMVVCSAAALGRPYLMRIGVLHWRLYVASTARDTKANQPE